MKLSREYLTEIIQFYGFSECGQILSFLTYVCEEFPDVADLFVDLPEDKPVSQE